MADPLHNPFNKLKSGLRHIVGRRDSRKSTGELLGPEKEKSFQERATYTLTLNKLKTKLKTAISKGIITFNDMSSKEGV